MVRRDIDLALLADPNAGWRPLETVDPQALLEVAEELLRDLPAEGLDPLPLPAGRADPDLEPARATLWTWLDATRRVPFLRRIAGRPEGERWLALVLEILERTHYTMGPLFADRVRRSPERTWLRILRRDRIEPLSLATAERIVRAVRRGLLTLFPSPPVGRPVALLAENAPETVFCDLACLTGGLVDVTIPADATGEQAVWVLEQTEAEVLLLGSDRQADKVLPLLGDLPALRWVVRIHPGARSEGRGGAAYGGAGSDGVGYGGAAYGGAGRDGGGYGGAAAYGGAGRDGGGYGGAAYGGAGYGGAGYAGAGRGGPGPAGLERAGPASGGAGRAGGGPGGSDRGASGRGVRILTLDELMARGDEEPAPAWAAGRPGPRLGDPATLMYTSGTTGLPKGIVFSHRNIVYKRFCRALALPEIGEEDHFLCYLPLYHTFGRWLEMTGTLFWDATYSFMENPSLDALLDNLRRAQPTVFISIPKKWIQLHDAIRAELPESADARTARRVVERITGSRLRWGLSAAGYLDPAVFRFFQRHGVELLSGFGMTEATGGITMTPPRGYRADSVGRPLPGIEARRGEDGELLIRGPYVMQGYFGPEEAARDYRQDWFGTGDIFEEDQDGYFRIVDRKKDIYKNVRGQTIAPQRIEGFFQGFGEIKQSFLAGDGREYNTLLLWLDPEFDAPRVAEMPPEAKREYVNSIVVSVNGFLAPYERVLDFAFLPRPLDLEHGELTPKGTFRRKAVEEGFAGLIEEMYRSRESRLRVGGLEVRFPHWWLRETGLTLDDLSADDRGLRLPRLGRELPLAWDARAGRFRCGDLWYEGAGARVDLEGILRSPALWLGNHALVTFTGAGALYRTRRRSQDSGEETLRVEGPAARPELTEEERRRLDDALWREDRSLATLHLATVALQDAREKEALRLVAYLEGLAAQEDALRSELARIPLRRAVAHPRGLVRSAAFRALVPNGAPEMVGPTFVAFLERDPAVLNAAGAEALSRRGLPEEVMAAYVAFVAQVRRARGAGRQAAATAAAVAPAASPASAASAAPAAPVAPAAPPASAASAAPAAPVAPAASAASAASAAPAAPAAPAASTTPAGPERSDRPEEAVALDDRRTLALLGFLVRYAGDHPSWFHAARHEMARWLLSDETARVRDYARAALQRLTAGFRSWLGPEPSLAVDPVTGREYGWPQALRIDPDCDPADAARISAALAASPVLKEAIFVLSGGVRASLADIPTGGIRVRHLGTRYGKAVYRLSVQTRQAGTYEIAVNLAREMPPEEVEEEVFWLISLGTPDGSRPLVEEVGGYWPEHGLWTEEYVPGETVARLLERIAAGPEPADRLIPLWIHLAGSACTLYVDFWDRSGRRLVPGDPSPENLIVPAHDYQEGARLVSISERRPFAGLPAFLQSLRTGLLNAVQARHPQLAGLVGEEALFGAVVDVLGESEGAALLETLAADPELETVLPGAAGPLREFLDRLRTGRYLPRRLAGAIRRYHRWAATNPEATPQAAARTLHDLWDSYALRDLLEVRPETRLRLFRETVFADAQGVVRETLDRTIEEARTRLPSVERLLREMTELVRRKDLPERDVYFLARLTFAHLRPEETADLALVEHGGVRVSDLVVTHRDRAGRYFRVRHATSPREVWALHRLFFGAGIKLRYRAGHQFLVAVDENNRVLGGIVYQQSEPESVHMEKIVVVPTHRRQGISEGLMEDFFRRARGRGARTVTTGFYRPQYFRRFRFQVDREHAGLVRILEEESGPAG